MKSVFFFGDSKFRIGTDGLKTISFIQVVLSFPAELTGTVKATPLRISDRLLGLRFQNVMIAIATMILIAVTLLNYGEP